MKTQKYLSSSKPRLSHKSLTDVVYDLTRIHDLPASTFKTLVNLNLRDLGQMQNDIRELREHSKKNVALRDKGIVVVARHPKHGILGWGLLFNDVALQKATSPSYALHAAEEGTSHERVQWVGEFYVKRRFRGQGIGSELFTRMRMIRKNFYKYRHTDQAKGFFRKNGRREH